jgi:hypothetical protein
VLDEAARRARCVEVQLMAPRDNSGAVGG